MSRCLQRCSLLRPLLAAVRGDQEVVGNQNVRPWCLCGELLEWCRGRNGSEHHHASLRRGEDNETDRTGGNYDRWNNRYLLTLRFMLKILHPIYTYYKRGYKHYFNSYRYFFCFVDIFLKLLIHVHGTTIKISGCFRIF